MRRPLDFPGFEDADASNAAVAEQQALAVASVMRHVSLPDQTMIDTGDPNGETGDLDDGDGKLALLDMISKLDEEKETLEMELKQKTDELEEMKGKERQLKTELDQMRAEHEELRNSVEAEKFDLLESHEAEKDRIQESHQEEKRGLIEMHQRQTDELREVHEQEKGILQQSHEDETQSQQASFEQEKEALQKVTAQKSERLEGMLGERDALLQEKAGVLEKLQTSELAKAKAEKDHNALLDRIREIAKHAQCQVSKPAPDLRPKQVKKRKEVKKLRSGSGFGAPSNPSVDKVATLESLDAAAVVQKMKERIDQLLAAESKFCELEEQCENLRSQNASLEDELSLLQAQIESLQADTTEGDHLREQVQKYESKIDDQTEQLRSLNEKILNQTEEMDQLHLDHNQAIEDVKEEKLKLERRVENQRVELSNLNWKVREQQDEIAELQRQQEDKAAESEPESLPESLPMSQRVSRRGSCASVSSAGSASNRRSTEYFCDTLIVLCIDLSLSKRGNRAVAELVDAMFDKITRESAATTRFSMITHGAGDATIVTTGTNSQTFSAATAKTLFADEVSLGSRESPSYSNAMDLLDDLHTSTRDSGTKMKIYLIGDGYTGTDSFDSNNWSYILLTGYTDEVKLWSFCTGDHDRAAPSSECCFKSVSGCHDHKNGFNGTCIFPI